MHKHHAAEEEARQRRLEDEGKQREAEQAARQAEQDMKRHQAAAVRMHAPLYLYLLWSLMMI